jgi:opacity protein-like surface antigen
MRNARVLAAVGATLLSATAAFAADMGPVIYPPPLPVKESFSGWYLRGDIGMTNQEVGKLDNVLFRGTPNLVIHDNNFESGILFGLGAGFQWNSWLRTDVTGEYRGETGFHGFDTWFDGANARFNNYTAKKSEWLLLANAYVDLGTWWQMTPFIGAGVGMSRITIHSFRDAGTTGGAGSPTMGFADAASTWNFAWAAHAGIAYQVTKNFTVELAYRYLSLGTGKSGDIRTFDGVNNINNPMEFKNLTSHDVKLGVRWAFGHDDGPYYSKPVYAPPPTTYVEPNSIYAPPPPPSYPIGPRG